MGYTGKCENGLNGRAIDFAKLGQLFLQGGTWQGQQLIPAAWVKESTTGMVHTASLAYSYDYYWWGNTQNWHYHYFAWGNKGEFIYVVPEQQLVFVRFGTADNAAGQMPSIWPAVFEQLSTSIAQVSA